jgi:hypothetical protein
MKKLIPIIALVLIETMVILLLTNHWALSAETVQNANPSIQDDLSIRLMFSGVTDDGEQGSANRKEATSIHCTNTGSTNNTVEVILYQWNGTDIFTGTVDMPPMRTFTFSTQNTTIYFDDVLLGGSPGTDAIFQGFGVVLSEKPTIACTAQVLDPLGYPPMFMDKLAMHDANGYLVGTIRSAFLPLLRR